MLARESNIKSKLIASICIKRRCVLIGLFFILSAIGCGSEANDSIDTGGLAGNGDGIYGAAGEAGYVAPGGNGGVGAGGTSTTVSGAGGMTANGGSGGVAAGGTRATVSGAGGMTTNGGSGGVATGGIEDTAGAGGMNTTKSTAGAGGAGAKVNNGEVIRSAGCGSGNSQPSGNYKIDINGTSREYVITVPSNYDVNKPYKLVFAWHGAGGTAAGIAPGKYYGLLQNGSSDAIFVAGQGLEFLLGTSGWSNTNGQDVAFVKALLANLKKSYCIDEARVFSLGHSFGAIMSNTLGCEMGDMFRAVAPMSGAGPDKDFVVTDAPCVGQVAAWISHGNQDSTGPLSFGQNTRDYWVKTNHCQSDTTPTDPSPCVAYRGCDAGYPVVWCEFDGGHIVPTFAASAIWNFFSQF